jgi:hypothetical protein
MHEADDAYTGCAGEDELIALLSELLQASMPGRGSRWRGHGLPAAVRSPS